MIYDYFNEIESKNMQHHFMLHLDIARERAQVPFIITSGFRTKEENKKVGGVVNSKHLVGEAVDLKLLNGTQTARMVEALLTIPFFEVVIEKDHIHVEWNAISRISKLFIRNAGFI